jgi:acylphosphatase
LTRLHLVVRGRVQGVGFRWFAKEEAASLGVTGWARNVEDGSVEIEAEGDPEAVEAFVERIRSGPPAARVESVGVKTVEPKGGSGFRTA